MFPVTSRDEMRGHEREVTWLKPERQMRIVALDTDIVPYGGLQENELAALADDDLPAIWSALTARLQAIPEYEVLFQAAYPDMARKNWALSTRPMPSPPMK